MVVVCESLMSRERFCARPLTHKEQSATVEYQRFVFLRDAAHLAARENGGDLRVASYLGHTALLVKEGTSDWKV